MSWSPGPAAAQQGGELGHVGFFHPARAVGAAGIGAGVIGTALADLAAVTGRGLPGLARDQPDRGALPFAQVPAHRVDELVPSPGGQRIQAGDQPVAGPGAVAGHHQPPPEGRWQRADRRLQDFQVISHRVAPGAAAAQHPGQRLAGVVAVGQQRMVAKTLVVRLRQFLV